MSIPMLPDIGELSYNGVTFDMLKHSHMAGSPILDDAGRTTKWVEWILKVNGVIVLPDNFKQNSTDTIWQQLREQLTACGGALRYSGRGFGSFDINNPADAEGAKDVNWGPKPKILDFTPLGAGRSAAIEWQCSVCIPECSCPNYKGIPVQLTFETDLTFPEDCYSALSIRGNLEIPMTRNTQGDTSLPDIVDAYRQQFINPPVVQDYRCTHRDFHQSRDKRVMTWEFTYEEMPPMGLPYGSSLARGSYSVRPATPGPALCQWMCHLRNTYTIRKDFPRRTAYWSFLLMLMDRLSASVNGVIPGMGNPNPNGNGQLDAPGNQVPPVAQGLLNLARPAFLAGQLFGTFVGGLFGGTQRKAIIQNFGVEEGTYLDSKTVTFEASWRLFTTFRAILAASGLWRQVTHLPGLATDRSLDTDKVLWATGMGEIQGYRSWNNIEYSPSDDMIVDLCNCTKSIADGPVADEGVPLDEGVRLLGAGAGAGGIAGTNDDNITPEDQATIAGVVDPDVSWLDYTCNRRVYIDPGIAVHHPLPTQDWNNDDLGVVDVDDPDTMDNYDANGVNTKSNSGEGDIVQRMATTSYRVCLYGYGIRAGFEVPVPKLVKFAGTTNVIPDNGSWADQSVIANFSGVPIHLTRWQQWYLIPNVPKQAASIPANYAARIRGDAELTAAIPAPQSVPEVGAPGVQLPTFIKGS